MESQHSDAKNLGVIKVVHHCRLCGRVPHGRVRNGAINAMTPQEKILAPYLAPAQGMQAGRLAASAVDD
eukprot:10264544-Lingulodinium_polyedra.AAC.1